MAMANPSSIFRLTGLQPGVSFGFQIPSAFVTKDGLILHQENCLSPSGWHLDRLEALVGIRRNIKTGKINLENTAFARFTVNPDKSVALLHNPVNRCQTQPRAFPHFFCSEERFEDMKLSLGVHAGACIANG